MIRASKEYKTEKESQRGKRLNATNSATEAGDMV